MIYAIASAIIVLIANRVGHWLDDVSTGPWGRYERSHLERDFTLVGIFIATLAYLVIDHLAG